MPYYRCVIPKDSLTFEQRQQIATAFTDLHCGISAAPRNFVNVNFLEVSDRESEIADSHGRGVLKYHTRFFIAGGNRAGRPPEVKEQILNGLIGRFSDIGGIPRDQVSGHISEAPASWTMEGGHVLPDPGSESPEWYEQGRDLPRRQQLTGIVTRESATFAWILRVHRRNEAGKTRLDGVSLCDVISPSETGSNPCPGRPAPRLIQTLRT